MCRVFALAFLFIIFEPLHASAAVAISKDPTLVVCAASSCDVDFGTLPNATDSVLIIFRDRFTHGIRGTDAFPTLSAGQGCTLVNVTTQPGIGGSGVRVLSQYNSDTGSNAGMVGAAFCRVVGSTSGAYKVTLSNAAIHHQSIKGYILSGLDTAATDSNFFIRYLAGFTRASSTSMSANVTTTTNAAVFIICGPVDPTGLTHLNTGGGWTRCTGCPDTDATNGAPMDLVYKLNTIAATYTDDWTLTNASRSSCMAFSLKAP